MQNNVNQHLSCVYFPNDMLFRVVRHSENMTNTDAIKHNTWSIKQYRRLNQYE